MGKTQKAKLKLSDIQLCPEVIAANNESGPGFTEEGLRKAIFAELTGKKPLNKKR